MTAIPGRTVTALSHGIVSPLHLHLPRIVPPVKLFWPVSVKGPLPLTSSERIGLLGVNVVLPSLISPPNTPGDHPPLGADAEGSRRVGIIAVVGDDAAAAVERREGGLVAVQVERASLIFMAGLEPKGLVVALSVSLHSITSLPSASRKPPLKVDSQSSPPKSTRPHPVFTTRIEAALRLVVEYESSMFPLKASVFRWARRWSGPSCRPANRSSRCWCR